jgi:hypothetical protein
VLRTLAEPPARVTAFIASLRTVVGSPPVWDTVNTTGSHPARKDEAGYRASVNVPICRRPGVPLGEAVRGCGSGSRICASPKRLSLCGSLIGFRRLICRLPTSRMKSCMNVQCIAAAFKISRWPRLISYQKGGLPNGSPKLSMFQFGPNRYRRKIRKLQRRLSQFGEPRAVPMASDNSTLKPGPAHQSSCYAGFPRPASLGVSRFQHLRPK